MKCPIAQALERVGEWWSMLIVRDAFHGLTKFDEFQQNLGLSPTMLARRLNTLVRNDILYKQSYHEHPVRYEYLLTERGQALFPVLLSLLNWGNLFIGDASINITPIHRSSRQKVLPVLVDQRTGELLTPFNVDITVGAANDHNNQGQQQPADITFTFQKSHRTDHE
jgi:DNA-binding HxlR family transcriptional regulator